MARMPKLSDFRGLNSHRPPDWRWRTAKQNLIAAAAPCDSADAAIKSIVGFLQEREKAGHIAAAQVWPDLAAAFEIFNAGGPLKSEIEARLLAAEALAVIAVKTGVNPQIIAEYAVVFFDVSPSLQAYTWLMTEVVRFRSVADLTEAQIWKFLALEGGPPILDIAVDDFYGRPNGNEEQAAKARYVARSAAASWTGTGDSAALLDEACRLFPHLGRGGTTRGEKILAAQLEFARMAEGLPPLPEHVAESERLLHSGKDEHGPKSKNKAKSTAART